MGWTILYGALLALALVFAWASERVVYLKLGLYMLMSWTVYNVVVRVIGFPHGLLIDALADALIATAVGRLGYLNRSWPAFLICALFVLEEAVHLSAALRHAENEYVIHAALNGIFALQVLVVGIASGASMAFSGSPASRRRAPPVRARR